MKQLVITLMASLILLFACGPAALSPPPLTAADILDKASQRMEKVTSFHFELTQEGGGTPIAMGLEMKRAEGDLARPDRMETTIEATVAGMLIEVKVVTVGEETFLTNPLTRQWEPVRSEFKALSIFNPDAGIKGLLKAMTELGKPEDEQLDGRPAYRIAGKIPSKTLQPFTITFMEGAMVDSEVWVDKEDFLLRQVRLKGQITEREPPGIVRTAKLSRFDQKIDIKLPE